MDERLIPINGLIALLRGDGGWPAVLRDQGFERHQLEVPLTTPEGDTRVDALLYRREPDLILLAECKSGQNIDDDQAKKYLAADAAALRRTSAIPPALRGVEEPAVQAIWVGLEEHRPRLETGMRNLGFEAPLLTIDDGRARLTGAAGTDGIQEFDERHDGGWPPGRILVDHQSSDEQLSELIIPELISGQASDRDSVSVDAICEHILPEWPILSRGAQGDFRGRVAEAVRALAAQEFRGQFRFEPAGGSAVGRVVFAVRPAGMDPRGRTQAWQAQQRRAARAMSREPKPAIPGQLSLDDLAERGGLAE